MGISKHLVGLSALAIASSTASAVVTVSGDGSLIGRPYDADGNQALDAGVTTNFGVPSTGLTGDWYLEGGTSMAGAYDGHFSHDGQKWTWLQNNNDASGAPVYAQWNHPTGYQVGTLVYDVTKYTYGDVGGTANYTVKVAGSNPGLTSAAWSGISAPTHSVTTPNTSPVNVQTLDSVMNASSLRVEFSSTHTRTSNSHAFIEEVLVLPDRYDRLAVDSVTASGQNLPASQAVDNNPRAQWYHQTAGDEFLQLNFAEPEQVDALVVYTYVNFPSDFEVFDDANNSLAIVTGVDSLNTSTGDVFAIKFNDPSTTSFLRLVFTTNQQDGVAGNAELVPLQQLPIPEPASLALAAPLGALFLRRRPR